MSLIETTLTDRIAIVTLNQPERRNAMSLAMAGALKATLAYLEHENVGAVIVTGAPPAFSAGADLDDLEHADEERLTKIYDGFLAVAKFPKLTIAAVNGPAVGAGLNLALACDIRVVAQSARFDCRFLQLALHPGGGHTWMLQRLLGPQGAAAMLLAGEALDGEAAVKRGLAWSCVDDSQLLNEARRLAAASADAPAAIVESIKGTLQSIANVATHAEAVERELGPQLASTRTDDFKRRLETLRRLIRAKNGSKAGAN